MDLLDRKGHIARVITQRTIAYLRCIKRINGKSRRQENISPAEVKGGKARHRHGDLSADSGLTVQVFKLVQVLPILIRHFGGAFSWGVVSSWNGGGTNIMDNCPDDT